MKQGFLALAVSIATIVAAATPVLAQMKVTPVARNDSRLRLDLPGLKVAREFYGWAQDSNMNGITYIAAQVAQRAELPRGESYTNQAYGFASIQASPPLTEERLKAFGYLKERKLTVERSLTPDSRGDKQVLRFTVDGTDCVGFDILPFGVDGTRMGGGGEARVFGYYCGPPNVPLTDNDVQWVLWGNEVLIPPSKVYVRMAALPTSPISPALLPSGTAAATPIEEGIAAFRRSDFPNAVRLLRPLAEQGNADAQNLMAILYLNGQGVTKSAPDALAWFRKSADQGQASALANLGMMYRNGNGTARDYAEALKWLKMAADKGNAFAFHQLGNMYANGEGVPADLTAAKNWLDQAVAKYPETDKANRDRAIKDRDAAAAKLRRAG